MILTSQLIDKDFLERKRQHIKEEGIAGGKLCTQLVAVSAQDELTQTPGPCLVQDVQALGQLGPVGQGQLDLYGVLLQSCQRAL